MLDLEGWLRAIGGWYGRGVSELWRVDIVFWIVETAFEYAFDSASGEEDAEGTRR